jgi:hypothetical protein
MELSTLADVRILVEKHLPKEYRPKFTWRQLAGLLWCAGEGQQDVEDPTEDDYRQYHGSVLNPYERERFRDAADQVLRRFATNAIRAERQELLRHHRTFRWMGVWEAVSGAAAWTALLIGVTIAAARGGVDLLEYYRRALGHG